MPKDFGKRKQPVKGSGPRKPKKGRPPKAKANKVKRSRGGMGPGMKTRAKAPIKPDIKPESKNNQVKGGKGKEPRRGISLDPKGNADGTEFNTKIFLLAFINDDYRRLSTNHGVDA